MTHRDFSGIGSATCPPSHFSFLYGNSVRLHFPAPEVRWHYITEFKPRHEVGESWMPFHNVSNKTLSIVLHSLPLGPCLLVKLLGPGGMEELLDGSNLSS